MRRAIHATAACDLVVASRNAKFATPVRMGGKGRSHPRARITCLSACLALQGAKVGIFCSTPAVELSRAVNTKLAMEMLLTGEPISAEQAQQAGLVNRIVDDASQLDDEVRRWLLCRSEPCKPKRLTCDNVGPAMRDTGALVGRVDLRQVRGCDSTWEGSLLSTASYASARCVRTRRARQCPPVRRELRGF